MIAEMDLFINRDPTFTKHIVTRGLLEEPFVVVDVGVLGGMNPRWQSLGDHLVLHGFDAGAEAIADLERIKTPGRHYHWCAIGPTDGEAEFYYNRRNPSSSSFIPAGTDRFSTTTPDYEKRRVPVRSLDSLIERGELPSPDFLKVDVEGFELSVFRGAGHCISTRLLGLEFETSMNVGPEYPQTHFGTLQQVLLPHGFRMFDLAFDRSVRASFRDARQRAGMTVPAEGELGQPGTFNVFFSRDLFASAGEDPASAAHNKIDRLLKQVMLFELYGLVDVAFDAVCRFGDQMAARIDPALACRLLLQSSGQYAWSPEVLAAEITRLGKGRDRTLLWCARTLLAETRWARPLRAIKRLVRRRLP